MKGDRWLVRATLKGARLRTRFSPRADAVFADTRPLPSFRLTGGAT
jgi:hypothetical protein